MPTYSSENIYIFSAADIDEKIARLKAIISKLEDQALLAAENADVSQYSLDDSQTKITTVYRDSASIARALEAYDTILNRWNRRRIGGGIVRLVDSKSVRYT